MSLVLAALVLCVGCSSDGTTAVATSPRGSWNLTTVAGAALPYVASNDATFGLVELVGQDLAINENTFTLIESYRQTIGGQATVQVDSIVGWAVVNGTSAHLTTSDGIDAVAVLEGPKLVVDGGLPFVYERR